MQKDGAQKLLFVINPISGGKNKNDWEAGIRNYLKEQPHNAEFYILNGKDDLCSVQHHINSVRPDKVVAVGGDGTIKLLAEALQKTSIPLGIIPAGSANGMARELIIPPRLDDALDVIINGQCRSIDLISINKEEICLHLSDIGINATLVKHFEESQRRGMWAYGKGIFKVLWRKRYLYVTLETDTETIKRKAFMVVLANARTYGTGAVINPVGKLDDGLFEIVVVRKLNFFELLKMLITHKPFDPAKIEIFSTRRLRMSVLNRAYFQVDGEYRGKIKSLVAEILPGNLHVMLPPDSVAASEEAAKK
jgi:YegS/Rv2252/BmrU family lipid kinase